MRQDWFNNLVLCLALAIVAAYAMIILTSLQTENPKKQYFQEPPPIKNKESLGCLLLF